jgi:hypothetical protein
MGESKSQNKQVSEQHGQRQGQNPSVIDQDRGNKELGSNKPGGDGQQKDEKGGISNRPESHPDTPDTGKKGAQGQNANQDLGPKPNKNATGS